MGSFEELGVHIMNNTLKIEESPQKARRKQKIALSGCNLAKRMTTTLQRERGYILVYKR